MNGFALGKRTLTSRIGGVAKVADGEEPSVSDYLLELARPQYAPLSRAREQELARLGTDEAIEELVTHNLRFVVIVAKRYQRNGVSMGDLICEGNQALMHAARKYQAGRGTKFISYAVWWLRQRMLAALRLGGRVVRSPATLNHRPLDFSLNSMTHDDSNEQYQDLLIGDDPRDDGGMEERLTVSGWVSEHLDKLPEREANIVRVYYGMLGQERLTLEEIGKLMGLTRERIRQLRDRALETMRRMAVREGKTSVQEVVNG